MQVEFSLDGQISWQLYTDSPAISNVLDSNLAITSFPPLVISSPNKYGSGGRTLIWYTLVLSQTDCLLNSYLQNPPKFPPITIPSAVNLTPEFGKWHRSGGSVQCDKTIPHSPPYPPVCDDAHVLGLTFPEDQTTHLLFCVSNS